MKDKVLELLLKLLDEVTLTPFIILAIITGSALGIKNHRPRSRWEAFLIFLSGVLISVFVVYPTTIYFNIESPASAAIIFVASTIGMSIVNGIYTVGQNFSKDPLGTITNIFKVSSNKEKDNQQEEENEIIE